MYYEYENVVQFSLALCHCFYFDFRCFYCSMHSINVVQIFELWILYFRNRWTSAQFETKIIFDRFAQVNGIDRFDDINSAYFALTFAKNCQFYLYWSDFKILIDFLWTIRVGRTHFWVNAEILTIFLRWFLPWSHCYAPIIYQRDVCWR